MESGKLGKRYLSCTDDSFCVFSDYAARFNAHRNVFSLVDFSITEN
jgi:hypothetical protein